MENKLKLNLARFKKDSATIGEVSLDFSLKTESLEKGTRKAEASLKKIENSTKKASENAKDLQKSLNKVNKEENSYNSSKGEKKNGNFFKLRSSILGEYKSSISKMKQLASSDIASPKFKIDASATSQLSQLDKILNKSANNITKKDLPRIIRATTSILKKNTTEEEKQTNIIAKQIAEYEQEQYKLEQIGALQKQLVQVSEVSKSKTVFEQMNTALDELKEKSAGVVKSLSSVKNSIKTFDSDLKNIFDFKAVLNQFKHWAVGYRIITGTLTQFWNFFTNLVQTAADYEESLNLYTVSLGKYASQGKAWAEEISEALYLDPSDIMQYTGALYNLVEGLGVASDAAYTMSTNLTQLAYDMSSYLNIDVESAYTKIQSAMTGQSRAVASAGVAMQKASLQELAYSLGIEKSVSSMTQAEKTYLRYIQIMRSTTKMQGDLARTIITPTNAIRVIKTQFTQLARAIGQVFIPVVLKAIPYVMALTDILKELANSLASALGYKIADIDYSGLSTADTYLENLGDTAEETGKKINRGLAAFDDLNVVESSASGTGGASDSVISDLEKYVTGYDMLDSLTSQFSTQIASARKELDKIIPKVKIFIELWAASKVLKAIGNIFTKISQVKKILSSANTGVTKFGKNIISRFEKGASSIQSLSGGMASFEEITLAGFRNMLTPIEKAFGAIGLGFLSFEVGLKIFREFNGTVGDFISRLMGASLVIGTLSGAAALLISGPAGIAVGIAGAVGAIAGLVVAFEELYKTETEQERYNTLFDGLGVSIEKVQTSFDALKDPIVQRQGELDTLYEKTVTAEEGFKNSRTALEELYKEVMSGEYSEDEDFISKLKKSTDEYKQSIEDNKQAHIDYETKVLENLREMGKISEEEYNSMLKSARNTYTELALLESDYADELQRYSAMLANGQISQEDYNQKVKELGDRYYGVIEPITSASDSIAALYYNSAKKIDLENPEKLKELVDSLKKSYDEGTASIELQKQQAHDYYDQDISDTQKQIDILNGLKEINGSLSEEQEKALTTYQTKLENLTTQREKLLSGLEEEQEKLTATYSNYLLTIYGQISEAGKLADSDVKDTVSTITSSLEGLGDFDASKSVVDLFGNLTKTMVEEGKTFSDGTVSYFNSLGVDMSDSMVDALSSATEKNLIGWGNELKSNMEPAAKTGADGGAYIGAAIANGTIKGIETGNKDINKAINDSATNTISCAKTAYDINSPSKVFEEIGMYLDEGLALGITDNEGVAKNAIEHLSNSISDEMNKTTLSLNIDTGVEKSFNTILDKLQEFTVKWRSGINSLLSNMKTSMNSISVGSDGKIKYTSMPKISIDKFAQGGYPTSGDLFFANENGIPEYITSVGNKTAVANQDQMVSALANAITNAVGNMNTNSTPGITQVYIGNEKVYEGQGKYQNRQADRYGTSYIKI